MSSRKSKQAQSKQAPRHRSLGIEQLESRVVLAGNVQAFVSGGNLRVNGDSADNDITITRNGAQAVTITGNNGTTINGQANQDFAGIRKDIRVVLGAGDDKVQLMEDALFNLVVKDQLSIDTGAGDDEVLIQNVWALRLNINTGAGDDTINIGDDGNEFGIKVTKEATINTGGGVDSVAIANSQFHKFLNMNLGAGSDSLAIQQVSFTKPSTINGGAGTDLLQRQALHGKVKFISFESVRNAVPSPAQAPSAVNDAATAQRGVPTNINVLANDNANGGTLDPTTVTITQQPTNGTATVNADGTIRYTATAGGAAVSDTLKYTVRNQGVATASNAATVTITITAAPTATAVNDTATVQRGVAQNINVLANDNANGGTLDPTTVTITQQPANGTATVNADGTIRYTATAGGAAANDTLQYTVRNLGSATASNAATVTITITNAPTAIAVNDAATVQRTVATDINVLGNDNANGGTLDQTSVTITQQPTNGTATVNANGTIRYTASAGNAAASDTLQYTVKNLGSATASNAATVTITINAAPTAAAVNDTATVQRTVAQNINVLANDNANGGTLDPTSVTITTQPTNGTATVNADGTIRYTAAAGNAATSDTLQYTVKNQGSTTASNAATVAITINAPPTPAGVADTATAERGTATQIDVKANDNANGGTLDPTSVVITQQPTSGTATVNAATGVITYTPTAGTVSTTDTLQYTIKNQGNSAASAATTVTITIFEAVDDTGSVTEDANPDTFTGNVLTNDFNATGATVTAVKGSTANVAQTVNGDNNFGTFNIAANGAFTYDLNSANAQVDALNAGQTLTDTISYTITKNGVTSTATITITINGANG